MSNIVIYHYYPVFHSECNYVLYFHMTGSTLSSTTNTSVMCCAMMSTWLQCYPVIEIFQIHYNLMGPLSHTQSVIDQNFLMWHMTVASPDMLDRVYSEQYVKYLWTLFLSQVLNMNQQTLTFLISTQAISMSDTSVSWPNELKGRRRRTRPGTLAEVGKVPCFTGGLGFPSWGINLTLCFEEY